MEIKRAKKEKVGGLDTYGEKEEPVEKKENKESAVKNIWNKTIFPDMIKNKKEEKKYQQELRKEAKEEAREEIKDKLKEQYKKAEIDKATGKKGNGMLGKIGKELSSMGEAVGKKDIGALMGMGGNRGVTGEDNRNLSLGGVASNEKLASMLGGGSQQEKQKVIYVSTKKKKKKKKGKSKVRYVQQTKQETPEEKIKRMLG